MVTCMFNPDPIILEETEKIENYFLSPLKLRDITGKENLATVESLRVKVNTKDTTIGNFGKFLPSLTHLDLNDSYIPLVRDIGSSLNLLTVLYMARCQLNDVDGISIMQNLKELYLPYNNISDIGPISFLDYLEVLDVQSNQISTVDQIDYLALMSDLRVLFLSGNPVCQFLEDEEKSKFEKYVDSKVLALEELNGVALKSLDNSQDKRLSNNVDVNADSKSRDPYSEFSDSNKIEYSDLSSPVPIQKSRPLSGSLTKPNNDSKTTKRSSPGTMQNDFSRDDSSFLTFGNRLCGNPMQALKSRQSTSLHPILALFNKEDEEKNTETPRPRPSTAVGYRRKYKAISDDQLKALQTNVRNSVVLTESHGNEVRPPESYFKTPSPPKPKAAYSLPAPPKTTQRPKSSHGFRSRKYKRSLSSRQTQSVDVVMHSNPDTNQRSQLTAGSAEIGRR